MRANAGTDGPGRTRETRRNAAAAWLALAATLAPAAASAESAPGVGQVELWLSDAPLALVLEQIAGKDGVRVVVGDEVEQRIDGRLDGQREEVLARLAVEHGLDVYAEGNTVWFDPSDRPVVSLVRLDATEAERARLALAPFVDEGSIVQLADEGLVLSGSRAFVEDARRHVASLPPPAAPAAAAVDAAEERSSTREVRSVWDIPGYDVDYTREGAS